MKRIIASIAVAFALALTGCTPSAEARYQLKQESENNYGVMRTVTAYSSTGEQIGQWHGKIDVQYDYDYSLNGSTVNGRVDMVVFDGDEPIDRIVISGATVIVDND